MKNSFICFKQLATTANKLPICLTQYFEYLVKYDSYTCHDIEISSNLESSKELAKQIASESGLEVFGLT